MNNDYDRESLTENVTITVDAAEEPAVKLVIMQSGTQVIAEVSEPLYGDYYILRDPRTVVRYLHHHVILFLVGSYSYLPLGFNGLSRVHQQVHKELVQLLRITLDLRYQAILLHLRLCLRPARSRYGG